MIRFPKAITLFLFAGILMVTANCERAADPYTDQPGLLQGKKVVMLVTEGFHDTETFVPFGYLVHHGAEVTFAGPELGEFTSSSGNATATVNVSVNEVSPHDFDALVIPGGRSPARLREFPEVNAFVQEFALTNRPTAAICHGPQVLISAGLVEGREIAGTNNIIDEITEAGATYRDVEVQIDGNLITSRRPGDVVVFSHQVVQALLN